MLTITNHSRAEFLLFPINDNCTAWRPVGFPVVLVVPGRRDSQGRVIAESSATGLRIAIENVPQYALVAGHDHVGLRVPDGELYAISLTPYQLENYLVDLSGLDFTNAAGDVIDRSEATNGDSFTYTTATGTRETVEYRSDADYYDLSTLTIATDGLKPGHYVLSYQLRYFPRAVADSFIGCIDTTKTALAEKRIDINHPGEALEALCRLVPYQYFTNARRDQDNTIAFLRPLATVLQDLYDEQKLLRTLNLVHVIQSEFIPYLSYLLGWTVPYFPASVDRLRRATLRSLVRLQLIKGSRIALIELFKLFGFDIYIRRLWYDSTGAGFILPNQDLDNTATVDRIDIVEYDRLDPIAVVSTGGFVTIAANLLDRPKRVSGIDPYTALADSANVTVIAILAETDAAITDLDAIVADISTNPEAYDPTLTITDSGLLRAPVLDAVIAAHDCQFACVLLTAAGRQETIESALSPIAANSCVYDTENNQLSLSSGLHLDDTTTLYVFAAYRSVRDVAPAHLAYKFSNRFNLQILTRADQQTPTSDVLDFLIDFVHVAKAFHSILNAVEYRTDLADAYLVTDHCVGADITQRYDVDAGKQQVPPAIIPTEPSDTCLNVDPRDLGYKVTDLVYRERLLTSLAAEYLAALDLDGRDVDTALNSLVSQLEPTGQFCAYTRYWQDRIYSRAADVYTDVTSPQVAAGSQATNHQSNLRLHPLLTGQTTSTDRDSGVLMVANQQSDGAQIQACDAPTADYCYAGRVQADSLITQLLTSADCYRPKPADIDYGAGAYWTFTTKPHIRGVQRPLNSRTNHTTYSGVRYFDFIDRPNDCRAQCQISGYDFTHPLNRLTNSFLGRLVRAYHHSDPEALHYSSDTTPAEYYANVNAAWQRPGLDISVTTMHLPGCRFISGGLTTDYISADWAAKPWDDPYSIVCDPTWLNAALTADESALVYDIAVFIATANGRRQDIPSYGDHGSTVEATHSVYQTAGPGHPAVTLDLVELVEPGTLATTAPLFPSAIPTNGSYLDYVDGYAASSGAIPWEGVDYADGRAYTAELVEALGIPPARVGTGLTARFLYGSGIRDDQARRYDCGRLSTPGSAVTLLDQPAQRLEVDSLEMDHAIELTEVIDSDACYDGIITNFLMLRS